MGEDVTLLGELHESFAAIRNGRPHDGVDASTRYYLMCITPNESRLSIRFYETSTLGDLDRNLAQYLRDTELVDLWKGCASLKPQPIRMYIRQTAALSKSDNVPETLVASTLRAMLRGEPFPTRSINSSSSACVWIKATTQEMARSVKPCTCECLCSRLVFSDGPACSMTKRRKGA